MPDSVFKRLASPDNLHLAFTRLATGANIAYKNYYRQLFIAFSLSLEENIASLSKRILGGSYAPSDAMRFYIPTTSGLQRMITLLYLDDLIVYQAIANILADRMRSRRLRIQYRLVFSSILEADPLSDFFVSHWRHGYTRYIKAIRHHYTSGLNWVGHFDLAAFYDTIDHNTLAATFSTTGLADCKAMLSTCLMAWSTERAAKIHHGIPQGPIASDFMAEAYLLGIDEALDRRKITYVRYSDDIRIFGKNREEVLSGLIQLERECKARGLIPQSKKFQLARAENIADAIGKFPSISVEEAQALTSDSTAAEDELIRVFGTSPLDVSRARYILKSSGPNDAVLEVVLANLTTYPELISEFREFLVNYDERQDLAVRLFESTLRQPPAHEFVEGTLWAIMGDMAAGSAPKDAETVAYARLQRDPAAKARRYGIYRFLCSIGSHGVTKWIANEDSVLLQALVIPSLQDSYLDDDKICAALADALAQRRHFEAMLVFIKELIFRRRRDRLATLPPMLRDSSGIVSNALGYPEELDTLGQLLARRFELPYWTWWEKLLGSDYALANEIIAFADKVFYIDSGAWLGYTDSFNDLLLRAFITLLRQKRPSIKWPRITGADRKRVEYGVLLDASNQLSRHYPSIAADLLFVHQRRNRTPTAHPRDRRTAQRARFVGSGERKGLRRTLGRAYVALGREISLII